MGCAGWLDVGNAMLLCLRDMGHDGPHVASPDDCGDLATYSWDEASGVVTVEMPDMEVDRAVG